MALALDIVAGADILIEGFRPGVMKKLGLDPATCRARNAHLVHGRMTGNMRKPSYIVGPAKP